MKFEFKSINVILSAIFLIFPFLLITGPALPDIFISLCAIYGLILFIFQKLYIKINIKFFVFLFLFWLSCVISSLLSEHTLFSLESSLPYIRFIFFLFLVYFLIKNNNFYFFNYIFIFITLAVLFVTFDTYLQFFFRNEIFGHVIEASQNRLTGPFRDDERIVGSYLSKFCFLAFGYLLYFFENSKKYFMIPFVFLLLVFLCIFVTGERMAFILTSFGILLVALFNIKYIKYFLGLIICISFISITIILNFEHVKNRVFNTTLQVIGLNFVNGKIEKFEYNFLDSHYGAHYLTAYEIFKENKYFGSGPKTFRIVCSNDDYSKLDSFNIFQRCSTHPHNYYFQMISEVGIIGIFLFLISFTLAIRYFIKNLDLRNPLCNCSLISLLLFLWPIQSTGSIFNNWYGSFPYYYLAILFILIFKIRSIGSISRPSS